VGGTIDEKEKSDIYDEFWRKKALTKQSFDTNCNLKRQPTLSVVTFQQPDKLIDISPVPIQMTLATPPRRKPQGDTQWADVRFSGPISFHRWC